MPGRPRDEASRGAILKAAFDLLQAQGYAALSYEAVARAAGTGKTTIYRWWPNRATLAIDAFFERTTTELAFPESGTAPDNFRSQLQGLAALLRSRRGKVLTALMIGSHTDPELARAIDERWVAARRVAGFERMQRALREGECVEALQIPTALDLLYSPLYAHVLLGRGAHTAAEVDRHCDFLFPAIFRRQ